MVLKRTYNARKKVAKIVCVVVFLILDKATVYYIHLIVTYV